MKFEELTELNRQFNTNELEDNSGNSDLNDKGKTLLKEYNQFIESLSEWITHEYVLDVIAYVSSTKKGTDKFKIASTLYSLTNNGATKIDKGVVAIHKNDDIIDYIEK
jgi:hypothetical protein